MYRKPPQSLQLAADEHWCGWCATAQSYQHFDLHIKACKRKHLAGPEEIYEEETDGVGFYLSMKYSLSSWN